MRLVDLFRTCNPRFVYMPGAMNPRRELTMPSEPVSNGGFDNSENDYILWVSDLIITPEGKE